MGKCPNCGAGMSCGCQKRTLPNGKVGCSKCANKPPTPPAAPSNKETPK